MSNSRNSLNLVGIGKNGGFLLSNPGPLDVRLVVSEFNDLSVLVSESRAYVGMVVYVIADQRLYVCDSIENSGSWKSVSGLTVYEGSPYDLDSKFANAQEGDMVVVVSSN